MGKDVYLGLDIGTDSVGYAVTDGEYNLLKYHGKEAWGAHIFDEASLAADRRSFRSARRRLDRRQQRVNLTRELFAKQIGQVDEKFFTRLNESYLYREDCSDKYILFNDPDYTDKDYYKEYPTIHHLIVELMNNSKPHDVRLVYIACAWLVAHRGHFLNNINKDNLSEIKDFESVYAKFMSFFTENGYAVPWNNGIDKNNLAQTLKAKMGVNSKYKELVAILFNGKKPNKISGESEIDEDFPFSQEGIIKLLAGGTYSLKDLYGKDEYDSLEVKSVSLGMDDEKLAGIMADIGDDYALIAALRSIYDWSLLIDILGNSATVSEAKVNIYQQHESDLEFLKKIIKSYVPDKFNEVFRTVGKNNYASYAYHSEESNKDELKKTTKEDFSKFILAIVKNIQVAEEDEEAYEDMMNRLELRTFLPKQKDTDNRVIPHQLFWYEMHLILENAKGYLPFLNEKDENGKTICDKLEDIFCFRVPYFVGPLNPKSERAWLVKKQNGKIYPWNLEEMVDLDASEDAFIKRLLSTCTYLPGEPVLPKDSLTYHRYMVLNEINNLRINNERISVELKQKIYNEVFLQKKKVTRKYLISWLIQNNYLEKGMEELVSGIDEEIHSNLVPQIAFKRILESKVLSENDVEKIIERAAYAEDKQRLSKWIERYFPQVSDIDRKYICSVKIKDFGRLSRKLLCELEGTDKSTGELVSVMSALWNTKNNLMEILEDSDKYTFKEVISEYQKEYYSEHDYGLEDRLDEMYLSNSVKRSVYRTLDIVKDVKKAFGAPNKIFVEMARGGREDQKGKRTKSRKQQILELYSLCKDEDVRLLKQSLEDMGEAADSKLQGEKLFLYYMQLGKCMYTGKTIDINRIGNNSYCDIDHIYPQAYVKDDSVINNKVLVFSEENGKKQDKYPIAEGIRHSMYGYWHMLLDKGLLSEEKFKRLTRATPFTDEEKYSFINRQIVETTQSTKAVATLLKEYFPNAEIVYSKAKLTSEFRQEFGLYKSRLFNDLHHAVDAYLNIVVGNVYNSRFTKNFKVDRPYSIKTKTVFTHPVKVNEKVIWDGESMLAKVKKIASKNTAHFTKYAYMKKGGLFDQMPVSAAEGLTPLKKGLPTEKYGGYNKAGVMFYIPIKYSAGKKTEIFILPVELLAGDRFLADSQFATEYAATRIKHITGKAVNDISFPMGMRPWKVNTVLSLDGFRVCISGTSSGGSKLIIQSATQFSAESKWREYLKKLESFAEKYSSNSRYVYDITYDKVSTERNMELYDLYISKFQNSIYSKRRNPPTDILIDGRDRFESLSIEEQSKALLCIHQTFGRIAGGCDLSLIGGGKNAAVTTISTAVSNWSKNYDDVHVVDISASGIWEKHSQNLLELL